MVYKERWSSRFGLVLAMAGNAVGLGNFLRFPAQAAKNGGGAFLIPYMVALVLLGLPLIWVEWTMGRYGGQFGDHSTPGIFDRMGRRWFWKYLGVFGLWTNLIIASYYLYIESWTMAYAGYSLVGGFSSTSPEGFFAFLTGEKPTQLFAFSPAGIAVFLACVGVNVWILSRGLAKGIELVSRIGMPLLIVFAVLLAIRGLLIVPSSHAGSTLGQIGWVDEHAVESPLHGLNFVWEPRLDSLANPSVWLAAAGQVFFTLGIGMGTIHCYASYVRQQDDIVLTGSSAAWTNEFCEVVLGGSILLPIAVAYLGQGKVQEMTAGGSGFSLGFIVFPKLFQNWGAIAPAAGFLWFGLLFFAAITSSLAMGQPIMSFLQREFQLSRSASALAFGGMLVPLAFPVACLTQRSFFDEFDYWAGTLALAILAVSETILFAWVFGMDRGWEELNRGSEMWVPRVFYYIIKYITPLFLVVVLLANTFQPAVGWQEFVTALIFGRGRESVAWQWSGDGMIGKLFNLDLVAPAGATEAELNYLSGLRWLRGIDRGVMVVSFLAVAYLVFCAWKRRAIAERVAS